MWMRFFGPGAGRNGRGLWFAGCAVVASRTLGLAKPRVHPLQLEREDDPTPDRHQRNVSPVFAACAAATDGSGQQVALAAESRAARSGDRARCGVVGQRSTREYTRRSQRSPTSTGRRLRFHAGVQIMADRCRAKSFPPAFVHLLFPQRSVPAVYYLRHLALAGLHSATSLQYTTPGTHAGQRYRVRGTGAGTGIAAGDRVAGKAARERLDDRIRLGSLLCLSRPPSEMEQRVLREYGLRQLGEFSICAGCRATDDSGFTRVGTGCGRSDARDDRSVLLNTDNFITRE